MAEPGDPRDLGENFRFIAQVADVFKPNSKKLEEIGDKINFITTAGKYGFIFISDQSCIKVFQTKSLIDENDKIPFIIIELKGEITHIYTSCDCQTLFVSAIINNVPFAFFYDVFDMSLNKIPPSPFYTTPLCTIPGSRLSSVSWNPCDPSCIALVITNGDLFMIKIKENSIEFSSKKNIAANSITWSAKGKQLAVGKSDATISLFKPDLTPVRDIERPPSEGIGPVINMTWFTNTEFFIAYLLNGNAPVIYYLSAPKGKPAVFCNFEDVCYSGERQNPISYYTLFISEWNLLFALSSHGVEMGIIGKSESGSVCNWCQWFPDENGRASMNFVNVVQETFPLGFAIDFTSEKTFASKDENMKGPFPVLLALSTGGELNIFFVENNLSGIPKLNIKKEIIPSTSNLRTPSKYGQQNSSISLPAQASPVPESILQLNKNTPSAFSTFPKDSNQNLVSSTPIKPLPLSPSLSNSFLGNTISPKSESPARPTGTFLSAFVPKPVSLSSEVGVSSNLSKILHVPSPKKSIGSPLSVDSVPQTPSTTPLAFNQLSEKEASVIASPKTPAAKKATTRQLMHLIKEELEMFEKEMQNNRKDNELIQYQVGTKEEDEKTNKALSECKKWVFEISKTEKELNDEISKLHENTLDALVSYEDANSYKNMELNSKNLLYMKLRPLDPYSQRILREIRYKYQYIVSQISEVYAKLDSQWEEYSVTKKNKSSRRLEHYASENLYRSVLNLHNSRVSFEKKLDEITKLMKKLCSTSFICSSFPSSPVLSPTINRERKATTNIGVSPQKIAQLTEVLQQRIQTPIRNHTLKTSTKKPVMIHVTDESFTFKEEKNELNIAPIISDSPSLNKNIVTAAYEEISPPNSPEKTPIKNDNPLAALSSLVGKVSQPDDQKLPTSGFSNVVPFNLGTIEQEKKELTSHFTSINSKNVLSNSGIGLPKPHISGSLVSNNQIFAPSSSIHANLVSDTLTNTQSSGKFETSPSLLSKSGSSMPFKNIVPKEEIIPITVSVSTTSNFVNTTTQPTFSISNMTSFTQSTHASSILGGQTLAPTAPPASTSSLFKLPASNSSILAINQVSDNNVGCIFGQPSSTPSIGQISSAQLCVNSSSTEQVSVVSTSVSLPLLSNLSTSTTNSGLSISLAKPTISAQPISSSAHFKTSGYSTLFGQTTTTSSSIFGHILSSTTGSETLVSSISQRPTTSILGQALSTTSVFGVGTSKNTFVFGGQTTMANAPFGSSVKTTENSSLFMQPNSNPSSIFTPDPKTTATIFGQVTSISSSHQSPITTTANSSTQSIFGQNPIASVNNTQTNPPNFTSLITPNTVANSIFTQTIASSLPLQNVAATTPGTSSIFGQSNTNVSLLNKTTTAASSVGVFGQSPAANTSSVTLIFGQSPTNTTTSIFGQGTTASSSLGFNSQASTTSTIFGGNVTSSSSQSIFGSNTISSGSVFGQNAPAVSSTSVFGQSGSIFGQPSSETKVGIGSSIFGNPPSTSTNQSFPFSSGFTQQNSGLPNFGGESIFGGLGKAPSQENAAKNVFGSVAGGSSSVPQTNIFGGGGSAAGGSVFGGGNATGNATLSPKGIGAFSPVKSTATTFGGNPSFGASPSFGTDLSKNRSVFGGTSTFGSASIFGGQAGGNATFGSSPNFGNSTFGGSVFGSNPAANTGAFSGFASGGGGTTFGSVANQSSSSDGGVSFGQLSNKVGIGGSPPMSGSSFTSWRS